MGESAYDRRRNKYELYIEITKAMMIIVRCKPQATQSCLAVHRTQESLRKQVYLTEPRW